MLENLLQKVWQSYKLKWVRFWALVLLVLLIESAVIGKLNDIGFSPEIIQHRWEILAGTFLIALVLACGIQQWQVHREITRLQEENKKLRQAAVEVPLPREFFVTNGDGYEGLRHWSELEGQYVGKAWKFRAYKPTFAIYGPYLPFLGQGKYTAIFEIKIEKRGIDNRPILTIDVASNIGQKTIAARDLDAHDFDADDQYQKFSLDFEVISYALSLEFRVISKGSGDFVTFNCVRLERR